MLIGDINNTSEDLRAILAYGRFLLNKVLTAVIISASLGQIEDRITASLISFTFKVGQSHLQDNSQIFSKYDCYCGFD